MAQSLSWPELSLDRWVDTYATLHRYMQIVGKVRLALSPWELHWWHVAFYLTTEGLTTSPIPFQGGTFEIDFDFIRHQLKIRVSDGSERVLALTPKPVAKFYDEVMQILRTVGVDVHIWDVPVEIPNAKTPFSEDREHASYDPDSVHRFWQVLVQTDVILKEFRSRFIGRTSPVHFFWGSFDLTESRFSGRPAPSSAKMDVITREAYSAEVSSAGFWPGTPGMSDAAFYSYFAPVPPAFSEAQIRPSAAYFHPKLGEFLLPYEAVRTSAHPKEMLLEFFQSTYEAGARLAQWDRAGLERH